MARWFRVYSDAMRNPKVASLSDGDFRLWVELLSIAAENDGRIPPVSDLKHLLRRRLDHLKGGLDRLIRASLMDALEDGYEPHSWSKFQYKSDTSTDRVARHRAKRNVSETPPDTDTDTDTEVTVAKATDANASSDKKMWDDALAYLGGSNKRSLVGKWIRDHGKADTAKAITEAQLERVVDPVAYVERILRKHRASAEEFPM